MWGQVVQEYGGPTTALKGIFEAEPKERRETEKEMTDAVQITTRKWES